MGWVVNITRCPLYPRELPPTQCIGWAGWRSWYSDWLGAGRSRDQIPVGARFSAPVQTGPGAHPASCTMGTGAFLKVKSNRGVTPTLHPFLVPWSRKGRAIPLLPLWAIWPVQSLSACTRVHFTFYQCTGAVYPKANPNGCRKSRPTGIQYLYCPARSESLHCLCSPRSVYHQKAETCCLVDRYFCRIMSKLVYSSSTAAVIHDEEGFCHVSFNDIQTWGQFQGWTSTAVTPTPDPCAAGASKQLWYLVKNCYSFPL